MNDDNRKVVATAKNAFIVYVIIEFILALIIEDGISTGSVIGVLIASLLTLWIGFKLLNSYDSVLIDIESQQCSIQSSQETIELLEKEMKTLKVQQNESRQTEAMVQELEKRMEYLESGMRIVNQKDEITADDRSSIHSTSDGTKSAFGLAEGFVQCGRCKEIQLASHTQCWKCNADLTQ